MESVNKRVILIALIMALLTSFLIYTYIQKSTTTQVGPQQTIKVYIASKTLQPKTKIVETDIKEAMVAKDFYNPKAVLNKADIVGKRIKDRIIEGEQILKDRLADDSNMALAYNIPEGKRAVSVNVNEQTEVADLLRPGDFVDVIATLQKDQVEDKTNKYIIPGISKIVIQNIQVLALGQEQIIEEGKTKDLPKTVTVAVTPQEAEKLVFASEFGVIRMALRAVGDNKIVNTDGSIRNDVVPSKGLTILSK